jgi:DNA helicase-2/ATP-dependent DNA helicase PcrA
MERLRAHATATGATLYAAAAGRDEVPELKTAAKRALGELHAVVASLAADLPAMEAGPAVQEVLKRSGLLARLGDEKTDEASDRAENLMELVAAAREFDESLVGEPPPRDPEEIRPPPLARFLERIALLGEADAETPEGRVALMTLHAAKGLEFDAVLLAGLEDGTLPHEKPWMERSPVERAAHLDEERRLCYVGMTRAKSRLTLSLARRRIGFGEGGATWRNMEPSRFLADLPPELFGLPGALPRGATPRGPVIRHHPGALPGDPHIELDGPDGPDEDFAAAHGPRPQPPRSLTRRPAGEPTVDYSFDQRPAPSGAPSAPFRPGERVLHASLGEGVVVACDAGGRDAKATVRFFEAGEKRVIARFLSRAE